MLSHSNKEKSMKRFDKHKKHTVIAKEVEQLHHLARGIQ